jgi:hypothetical protein
MKKNINNIFVIILVLLCTSFVTALANEGQIADNNILLCKDLGMISTSVAARDTDTVTKAEFAEIMLRLKGYNAGAINAANINEYIETVPFLSELRGSDSSRPITLGSAAKIVVCVLGYEQIVLNKGAYIESYINEAVSLGVTKGINKSFGEAITVAEAARMTVNTFSIPYVKMTSVVQDHFEYTVTKETILNVVHDIYKDTGIVTATSVTGLYSPSKAVGRNMVVINSVELRTEIPCVDYIGKTVTFYYKKIDNMDNVLLNISERYESLKIISDNIENATLSSIRYLHNNRTATVNIDGAAAYFYNGVAFPDLSEEHLKPESGYIVLSSSKGDSIYDVVSVWDFETVAVYDFNYERYILTDIRDRKIELDMNLYKEVIVTDEKGNSMFIVDIRYGSVCSIAKGPDKRLLKIIVSKNMITGTVTGASKEYNKIAVDNVEYELSKGFVDSGSDEYNMIRPGLTGNFYVDAFGKIADIEWTDEDGMFVGYVIAVKQNENGIDKNVSIKFLTSQGNIEVLECENKIIIDGQKDVSGQDIVNALNIPGQPTFYQLIRYRLNTGRRITEIDTAYTDAPKPRESVETLKIFYNGTGYFKSTQYIFGGKAPITTGTIVFNVPALDDVWATDKDFSVSTGGSLSGEQTYRIISYVIGDKIVGKYLANISRKAASDVTAEERERHFAVVKEISTAINENGEKVQKLECYYRGNTLRTYYTANDSVIPSTINVGDVMFLLIKKDVVHAILPIYTWQSNEYHLSSNPTSPTYYLNEVRTCFGRAIKIESGFVQVYYGDDPRSSAIGIDIFRATSYAITVVEKIEGKTVVTPGSIADIDTFEQLQDDCSRMVVLSTYGDPRYMVVYKQ